MAYIVVHNFSSDVSESIRMRIPVRPSDDVIVRDFPTSKQNGGFE